MNCWLDLEVEKYLLLNSVSISCKVQYFSIKSSKQCTSKIAKLSINKMNASNSFEFYVHF